MTCMSCMIYEFAAKVFKTNMRVHRHGASSFFSFPSNQHEELTIVLFISRLLSFRKSKQCDQDVATWKRATPLEWNGKGMK